MDRREPLEQLSLNRGRRLARVCGPFIEGIERDENSTRVWRVRKRRAGEADDVDGMRDPGNRQRDFDSLAVDLIGARERRCRWQLRDDDQIAAVKLRNESDRCLAEFVQAERNDAGLDHQHHHSDPDKLRRELSVAARQHVEIVVEQAKEAVDGLAPPVAVLHLMMGLQQHGAKRRGQRQ